MGRLGGTSSGESVAAGVGGGPLGLSFGAEPGFSLPSDLGGALGVRPKRLAVRPCYCKKRGGAQNSGQSMRTERPDLSGLICGKNVRILSGLIWWKRCQDIKVSALYQNSIVED